MKSNSVEGLHYFLVSMETLPWESGAPIGSQSLNESLMVGGCEERSAQAAEKAQQ